VRYESIKIYRIAIYGVWDKARLWITFCDLWISWWNVRENPRNEGKPLEFWGRVSIHVYI
jgi:hypothetical protein